MPRQLAQRFLSGQHGRSAFMLWSGIPSLCQRYQQTGRTVCLDGLIHVEHAESLREKMAWVIIDSPNRFAPSKATPDLIDHYCTPSFHAGIGADGYRSVDPRSRER